MVASILNPSVRIDSIAAGGEGVGRLPDGRTVFVHRTAPGDVAVVKLTKRAKRWGRGRLVTLTSPSAHRREPPCVHYSRCGGCTLQHLPYPDQLEQKRRIVEDAFRRIGKVDVSVESVVPSPREFGYRSRATFELRRVREGGVEAGFHELHRAERILDVGPECLLLNEGLRASWESLRAGWGPGARYLPGGPRIHLTLRQMADGAVLVVKGGRDPGSPDRLLEAVPEIRSVWWTVGGDRPRLLAGEPLATAWRAGSRFDLAGSGFLQANPEAADDLWNIVVREVGPVRDRSIVDAYAGVGVYGRALARLGARVTAIEADPDAVDTARRDPPETLRVTHGRVEEHLRDALPADIVLLNPPRVGLSDTVPAQLSSAPAGRLVYVSCNPATLARDAARLTTAYRLTRAQAVDLFPQTAHVEVVATFEGSSSWGGDPGKARD
jgi:23S rRNA (uracil1939-C5)-methyltransferase